MPIGPGKYDHICTDVRLTTAAEGVVLIVFNGDLGSGFSVQANARVQLTLPDLLEEMARQIREDMKGAT